MPKFFVEEKAIKNNQIKIEGEDVNHIKNVLRKKIGDKITIGSKKSEFDYLCEIEKIEENSILANIIEQQVGKAESNIKITIMQGLPKADKMELIIQKSVELGVYDIIPVEMKRCVVKLNEKDRKKKIERWQKIAEVASKQSGRNRVPIIHNVISIKNICNLYQEYDIVIVAYEKERENKLKYELKKLKETAKKDLKIAILIGPEGGIEEEELKTLEKDKIAVVTLGNRILRTETVAMHMISIILYELEEDTN